MNTIPNVILDTDAYNEIDDQFAISYLLRSSDKIKTLSINAAPFFNPNSSSPADGMEKSYHEIYKILDLCGKSAEEIPVFRGSTDYLKSETEPVISDAADNIIRTAKNYSPENPLYVVAIGAITNVASALISAPEIAENLVIVWLGGHARHWHDTKEFNMMQDIAAARVVIGSKAKFVQLPCFGVVSAFTVSGDELEKRLFGKNPLADYLAKNTVTEAESYAKGKPWTRPIWDVTAVAWLTDKDRFMLYQTLPRLLPDYDNKYEETPLSSDMEYVYYIDRDALMEDLFEKLLK